MSKLAIQYVSPEDVRPYAGNARTHSKRQIRQIADSIQRFGFTNPLLVSGNREVVAGHGRLVAAKLLGLASVPIVVLADMTEADRRAYVIADNKLAELRGGIATPWRSNCNFFRTCSSMTSRLQASRSARLT